MASKTPAPVDKESAGGVLADINIMGCVLRQENVLRCGVVLVGLSSVTDLVW